MEPVVDRREYYGRDRGSCTRLRAAAMEPAGDQREYEGGLDQWVGQAAAAMEPAFDWREDYSTLAAVRR